MSPTRPESRWRRAARAAHRVLAVALTVAALTGHARLYHRAAPEDAVASLRFVRAALDRGAGAEMQALFPEGYLFAHALHGLAWAELGARAPAASPRRAEALREARRALAALDSADGRAPFSPALDPPYGVFHAGWSAWLRGTTLALVPEDRRDPAEVARYEAGCDAIARAFDAHGSPFLPAYPGAAWPVDSTVAAAALRLHDALRPPRYGATLARWVAAAKARVDPATGLLPHRVDAATGAVIEGSRGSSQSIIARFLVEVDPAWGAAQYARFRRRFVATPLALPGVREHPRGVAGGGDVDSGPLLAGVSMSATVVAAGAARVHGDEALAGPLFATMEFFGLPVDLGGERRYGLGLVPVGDAFIAWSNTARPWVHRPAARAWPAPVAPWWRLPAHGIGGALVLLAWLPALVPRRRRGDMNATRAEHTTPD